MGDRQVERWMHDRWMIDCIDGQIILGFNK